MERTCDNCINWVLENVGGGEIQPTCDLGEVAFVECQCACTDDYFEPNSKASKRQERNDMFNPLEGMNELRLNK